MVIWQNSMTKINFYRAGIMLIVWKICQCTFTVCHVFPDISGHLWKAFNGIHILVYIFPTMQHFCKWLSKAMKKLTVQARQVQWVSWFYILSVLYACICLNATQVVWPNSAAMSWIAKYHPIPADSSDHRLLLEFSTFPMFSSHPTLTDLVTLSTFPIAPLVISTQHLLCWPSWTKSRGRTDMFLWIISVPCTAVHIPLQAGSTLQT